MQAGWQRLLGSLLGDPAIQRRLALLTAINGLLVAIHAVRFVCLRYGLDGGWLMHPMYSIETNGGFAELFGYGQMVALLWLLVRLAGRTRQVLYLGLALVFAVVLFDDVLGLDQTFGADLASALRLPGAFGFEAQCLGELVVFALAGGSLLALLTPAFACASAEHRRIGAVFLGLSAALAFFAVAMDLVHIAYMRAFFGSRLLLEVLEEGGEMATITLALVLALALGRQLKARSARPALRPQIA